MFHNWKSFVAAGALLLLASIASAFPGHKALPENGEYTIEWTRSIEDVKSQIPFAHLDDTNIGLRPIPKEMVKTPPRMVLSAGDTVRTKVFVYPGKPFHVALVAKDGSGQFYLNGYPDGDPFPLAKAKSCTPADDIAGLDFTETDRASRPMKLLRTSKRSRRTNPSPSAAIAATTPALRKTPTSPTSTRSQ